MSFLAAAAYHNSVRKCHAKTDKIGAAKDFQAKKKPPPCIKML